MVPGKAFLFAKLFGTTLGVLANRLLVLLLVAGQHAERSAGHDALAGPMRFVWAGAQARGIHYRPRS